MAGFGFSEAQEMFRRQVRDFAQKELAPKDKERSKLNEVPRDLVKRIGEMGYMGIALPEEDGGQGADWVSFGIATEELGKASLFAGFYIGVGGISYAHLKEGSKEVRQEWLPQVLSGDKLCSWAITEPEAGSDATNMKTTATRDGDYYILNGEKTSITLACAADACVILAKTDPKAKAKGITAFWVPMNLPGISVSRLPHSGWKPMLAGSISLENVRVPAKNRCGEEGRGFYTAMGMTDVGRANLGLLAMARAETSLEETMAYAVQRTAFGQPIAKFEGVSFKIAEHATCIEAAKLLCYRTFYLMDQGLPRRKEAAMCKSWCPKAALDVIHDCLLIHGHLGYSEEYPLEQRLRDAIGLEFTDGMANIMKINIARELMGKVAVPY